MKQIGIITFHFANNYGAVLQTFALYKVIAGIPGCEPEIIPFCKNKIQYIDNASVIENILITEKMRKLRLFLKRECDLEENDIENLETYKRLDYYIAGSDQIWNTTFKEVCDYYFLSFAAEGAKKISYASSIGININKEARLDIRPFRQYLPSFKALSVRESEHVAFIEKMSKQKCQCVIDPTMLLNVEEYDRFIANRNKKCPFLFLFWLEHDNTTFRGIDYANLLALKYNLQIIHYFLDVPERFIMNSGGSIYFKGIDEFLWHIKNADIVITNSFHATVFSVLFHKPFYTFLASRMRSRIDTLLSELCLQDRIIKTFLPLSEVSMKIDYQTVDKKIEKLKMQSMNFLKNALDIF